MDRVEYIKTLKNMDIPERLLVPGTVLKESFLGAKHWLPKSYKSDGENITPKLKVIEHKVKIQDRKNQISKELHETN